MIIAIKFTQNNEIFYVKITLLENTIPLFWNRVIGVNEDNQAYGVNGAYGDNGDIHRQRIQPDPFQSSLPSC